MQMLICQSCVYISGVCRVLLCVHKSFLCVHIRCVLGFLLSRGLFCIHVALFGVYIGLKCRRQQSTGSSHHESHRMRDMTHSYL